LSGTRIDTYPESERSSLRRDTFGFVFQFGQLVPELTAEENVALPLLLGGVRRNDALARAREWFGRLGIDGLERRRSGELSGVKPNESPSRADSLRVRRCSSPTNPRARWTR